MLENSKKSWKDRGFDFVNNIYAGIALMVICSVGSILYTRFGQAWEIPIVNGLITGAIVLSLFLSARAVLSLPTATAKTTPDNVGAKVLGWLHKFGLTVKSCTDEPQHDFFLIVTTEGGKKIGVNRHLTIHPDYLTISGLLTLTDEEKSIVAELTELEKFDALFRVQTELWRGAFGFDARTIETTGLTIHFRIPITEHLKETDVIDGIWRMEAIIGNVMAQNAWSSVHRSTGKKSLDVEGKFEEGPEAREKFNEGMTKLFQATKKSNLKPSPKPDKSSKD